MAVAAWKEVQAIMAVMVGGKVSPVEAVVLVVVAAVASVEVGTVVWVEKEA